MTEPWQRTTAVILLASLGAGIIVFMVQAITKDGALTGDDGGWLAAAFLSLREVMSKIESVALRRPVGGD